MAEDRNEVINKNVDDEDKNDKAEIIIEFCKTARQQSTLTEMQTNQKLTIPVETSTKTLMIAIKMKMLAILMKK